MNTIWIPAMGSICNRVGAAGNRDGPLAGHQGLNQGAVKRLDEAH